MTEPLVVETVHMYEYENSLKHHTSNFELIHLDNPTAVLRRGQDFVMLLRCDRQFDNDNDIIRLKFNFGPNPNPMNNTQGVAVINNSGFGNINYNSQMWTANLMNMNETDANETNDIIIEVKSLADIPVGQWKIIVETSRVENPYYYSPYYHSSTVYFLFNPWNKEDSVYMKEEDLLEEYVLNDVGKIWIGAAGTCTGREWLFGQFDAKVLSAAMTMFSRSDLKPYLRGNPVQVVRTISKMVNCFNILQGDQIVINGILWGRWDGEYEDGVSPSSWTGSVPILEKYLEFNGETPVKYGQCWVFAGVVTTICRALGIPSRVVTNFLSAHDTDGSLSVDCFYDADMNPLDCDPKTGKSDSIWNYHVWNDVWMMRPDLPKVGYSGWQTVDGTPQEQSSGVYQCGPASVEAIRLGAVGVGFNYDVPFMIAAVNADVLGWKQDDRSAIGFTQVNGDPRHIGKMIITKAPFMLDLNGDRDRQDITDLYKLKEGTEEERIALYRAVGSIPFAKQVFFNRGSKSGDIQFQLLNTDNVFIGEPFNITAKISNKSNEVRTVDAILSAESVFYNGVKGNLIKKVKKTFAIEPNESVEPTLTVTDDDYLFKLVEYSMVKIRAAVIAEETNETWVSEHDFEFTKPTLKIEVDDNIVAGSPARISISFQNPLKIPLTNCVFNYAGTGFFKNIQIYFRDIEPFENVVTEQEIILQKVGIHKLVSTFVSRELKDVRKSVEIEVS